MMSKKEKAAAYDEAARYLERRSGEIARTEWWERGTLSYSANVLRLRAARIRRTSRP